MVSKKQIEQDYFSKIAKKKSNDVAELFKKCYYTNRDDLHLLTPEQKTIRKRVISGIWLAEKYKDLDFRAKTSLDQKIRRNRLNGIEEDHGKANKKIYIPNYAKGIMVKAQQKDLRKFKVPSQERIQKILSNKQW